MYVWVYVYVHFLHGLWPCQWYAFQCFCCCCGGWICYFNILVHRPKRLKHFFGILIVDVDVDGNDVGDTAVTISAQRPFFLAQIVGPTSVPFKKVSEQMIAHIVGMRACVRAAIFVKFLFVSTFFYVKPNVWFVWCALIFAKNINNNIEAKLKTIYWISCNILWENVIDE